MAALIFNIAKGRIARYADLPNANDALQAMLLVSSGLSSDATILDDDTITAIKTHGTEASFTNYSRQTLASVTVTVDDTNDRVDIDCADPSWSPTSAQALGKLVIFYNPDTTAGGQGSTNDANCIPLFADDFVFTTPTSGTVTYQVASSGFARDS